MSTIRFYDSDGCKTIELSAIGEGAELQITLHPDGEMSLHHLEQGRQTDFCLTRGELTDMALGYVGLVRKPEGEEE